MKPVDVNNIVYVFILSNSTATRWITELHCVLICRYLKKCRRKNREKQRYTIEGLKNGRTNKMEPFSKHTSWFLLTFFKVFWRFSNKFQFSGIFFTVLRGDYALSTHDECTASLNLTLHLVVLASKFISARKYFVRIFRILFFEITSNSVSIAGVCWIGIGNPIGVHKTVKKPDNKNRTLKKHPADEQKCRKCFFGSKMPKKLLSR